MNATTAYPYKVQRVLNTIARTEYRPWQNVQVAERPTDHGALYVITAERPGGIFTAEHLQLFVAVRETYDLLPGLRMRASQRFAGGRISRFGDDVDIKTWRDLNRVGW